jgi:hypothetical protein
MFPAHCGKDRVAPPHNARNGEADPNLFAASAARPLSTWTVSKSWNRPPREFALLTGRELLTRGYRQKLNAAGERQRGAARRGFRAAADSPVRPSRALRRPGAAYDRGISRALFPITWLIPSGWT